MAEHSTETDVGNAARMEEQRSFLPSVWRRFDRAIVRATEICVFVIGVLFTTMVTLEVTSRYLLNFSIFFVNAASRFLLVWFFLIGAGLALRHGAHVGFELIVSRITPLRRRAVVLVAQAFAMVFFAEMVWAGAYSLGPAMGQTEPGLEIRLVWAFLAIPVGFVLMAYHMGVLILAEWRRPVPQRGQP